MTVLRFDSIVNIRLYENRSVTLFEQLIDTYYKTMRSYHWPVIVATRRWSGKMLLLTTKKRSYRAVFSEMKSIDKKLTGIRIMIIGTCTIVV